MESLIAILSDDVVTQYVMLITMPLAGIIAVAFEEQPTPMPRTPYMGRILASSIIMGVLATAFDPLPLAVMLPFTVIWFARIGVWSTSRAVDCGFSRWTGVAGVVPVASIAAWLLLALLPGREREFAAVAQGAE